MRAGGESIGREGGEIVDWSGVAELADRAPDVQNEEAVGTRNESQEMEGWPEALVSMRENWGDLEHTQGVFGPKTEMTPYEYSAIGENMTFEQFAEFSDAAYELGQFSEKAYDDLLFNKGCELQEKGLGLWTSFATVVRRYNVVKHLPELPEKPKFYFSTNLEKAVRALHMDSLRGYAANDGLPEEFNDNKLHLSLDLDGERAAGSDMVTFVLDDSIVWDDSFDLATRFPTVKSVELTPERQVVIAKNEGVYNRLRDQAGASKIPIVTRNEWSRSEWAESQGLIDADADLYEEERREEYGQKLIDEAVAEVDKAEVKEYVGEFLDKVDPQELTRLLKLSKKDYKQGARETVDYFEAVLGAGRMALKFEDRKDDVMGAQSGFGIKLNKRLKRHPEEMINTVAHEMFHEYQRVLERRYEKGELEEGSKEARRAELYALCKKHYDLLESTDWTYRNQILEEEAFTFGNGVEKMLRRSAKKRIWPWRRN